MLPIPFPFTCPLPPRYLPSRVAEGATVCDRLGNVWEFSAALNLWMIRGTIKTPPGVTEEQDGLVTPPIFDRLAYLKQTLADGLPPTLKIRPHLHAYWYLFKSTDRLIRFTQEGPSDLRLEVDRARIYSAVCRMSCPGDKGQTGDPGRQGPPGGPIVQEPCFLASTNSTLPTQSAVMSISPDGRSWSFDVTGVRSPLLTDLSIRLFDHSPPALSDDGAAVTVTIPPSGDQLKMLVSVVDRTIALEQPDLQYDRGAAHVYGTFTLKGGSWRDRPWCLRVRQKGPVGPTGPDASCFPTVQEVSLPPSQMLLVTCPIVQMRPDPSGDRVLSYCTNLFPDVCVQMVRVPPQTSDLAPGPVVPSGRLLAIKPQLDPCSDPVKWQFEPPDLAIPQLNLPNWTPLPGCQDATYNVQLPWVAATDKPADDSNWASPDGTRGKKYPWLIIQDPTPSGPNCNPCPDTGPPAQGVRGFLSAPVLLEAESLLRGITQQGSIDSRDSVDPRDPAGTGFDLWYGVLGGGCYCLPSGEAPRDAGDVNRGTYISRGVCEQQAADCVDGRVVS